MLLHLLPFLRKEDDGFHTNSNLKGRTVPQKSGCKAETLYEKQTKTQNQCQITGFTHWWEHQHKHLHKHVWKGSFTRFYTCFIHVSPHYFVFWLHMQQVLFNIFYCHMWQTLKMTEVFILVNLNLSLWLLSSKSTFTEHMFRWFQWLPEDLSYRLWSKAPVFSNLKTQAVMFSKMALEEIRVWAGEWEDGRSVGPRPEVRGEIREITVKEQFVLWSPFQTPAPIRWAWADGGNSRDYTRLTVIPLLWSYASTEPKTTARLERHRHKQRRRVRILNEILQQLMMVSIVTALKSCIKELCWQLSKMNSLILKHFQLKSCAIRPDF